MTPPVEIGKPRKAIMPVTRSYTPLDYMLCGSLVLLTFGIIYYLSLSFVYIEGDDATIVAYHAMGRDGQLQQPYSPYVSMLDTLLALLPPQERTVRITAMTLTAFSGPLFFLLMMLVAFDWCAELICLPRWLLVGVMLLAIPEVYYLSMVLTPSLIAMAFLLDAHLIIRCSTTKTAYPKWGSSITSLLLFGIGAAFRWDTIAYGLVITADLFFRAGNRLEYQPGIRERLQLSVGWGALAVLTWMVVLMFSGWHLETIAHIVFSSSPTENLDWKMGFSRVHTLFTPAFALLSALGYYILLRRKHPLVIIVPLAILPVAKFVLYGVPKWFITITPSLAACAVVGICVAWPRPVARYTILSLLVLPWLIGVQYTYGRSAWGPGFDLQRYDRVATKPTLPSPIIGAGMAVPTPEGPRPLFGHAWVLLGEWKRFVNNYAREEDTAVIMAIQDGVPLLLHPGGQGWSVNIYRSHGYVTNDSDERTIGDGSIIERRWTGPTGDSTRMLLFVRPNELFDAVAIEQMLRLASETVIISGFSSTLIRLHEIAPESLDPLGKRTAVLHLDRLYAKLAVGQKRHKANP